VIGGPSCPFNNLINDVANSSFIGSSARLLSFVVLLFLFFTSHILITKIFLLIELIPFLLIIMNDPTSFRRILFDYFLLLFGVVFFLRRILFNHILFFLGLFFSLLCFLPQLSCFLPQLFYFIHQLAKFFQPFHLEIIFFFREMHLLDVAENERVELTDSAFDVLEVAF
jgi:hypothetical protein